MSFVFDFRAMPINWGSVTANSDVTIEGANVIERFHGSEIAKLPLIERLTIRDACVLQPNVLRDIQARIVYLPCAVLIKQSAIAYSAVVELHLDSVRSLGASALFGCRNLLVLRAARCTTMGPKAVANNERMVNAFLPSLRSAAAWTFMNCSALQDLRLDCVQNLGCGALAGTRIVTFSGPGIRTLSTGVFANCVMLEKVLLGKWFQDVPAECWMGCSKLVKVGIPCVVSIGVRAFFGCTSLTTLPVPDTCLIIDANALANTGLASTLLVPTPCVVNRAYGTHLQAPLADSTAVDRLVHQFPRLSGPGSKVLYRAQIKFMYTVFLVIQRLNITRDMACYILTLTSYADMF